MENCWSDSDFIIRCSHCLDIQTAVSTAAIWIQQSSGTLFPQCTLFSVVRGIYECSFTRASIKTGSGAAVLPPTSILTIQLDGAEHLFQTRPFRTTAMSTFWSPLLCKIAQGIIIKKKKTFRRWKNCLLNAWQPLLYCPLKSDPLQITFQSAVGIAAHVKEP